MSLVGYLHYLFGRLPLISLATNGLLHNHSAFICPASLLGFVGLLLKYSSMFKGCWLVELGVYEVSTWFSNQLANLVPLVWYLFRLGGGLGSVWFFTSAPKAIPSIEQLYRNARWLEREAGELLGVFFSNKRDRRVVFTLPLFYLSPLRKHFPVGGFYELVVCPVTLKLVFVSLAYRS